MRSNEHLCGAPISYGLPGKSAQRSPCGVGQEAEQQSVPRAFGEGRKEGGNSSEIITGNECHKFLANERDKEFYIDIV